LLRRNEHKLWLGLTHHVTTGNKRMSFHDRPWLVPIYTDRSKVIVIMKSVQCGISEFLIIETIENAELGRSVFYVLPKYDLRNSFVANRIDKLFNAVPFYRARQRDSLGKSDSKAIKHFAEGTMKFASANTQSDFAEFPADVLIIDELDYCDQANLTLAPDRLKASPHKLQRKVGNPTIHNFGISDEFKSSDQKEWVVRCGSCGEYNELDFFKIVCQEREENEWVLLDEKWTPFIGRDIQCYCQHCKAPFNRLNEDAYWMRKNPASEISGYHVTRLMDAQTPVKELWYNWVAAQGNETKKQRFYNSDLGVPYESRGAKLSDFLLNKCVKDYAMPQTSKECIGGVDIGSVLHVKISQIIDGKRKAVYIGTVPTFEDIDRLMDLYDIKHLVIDALPETHEAKKLRDRFPGRVWLCIFHGQQGNVKDLTINEEQNMIVIDRTQAFDDAHQDVLQLKMELPRDASNIDDGEFYKQMCAPTRVLDEHTHRFVWREGSQADHYRLADVYEKVAQKALAGKGFYFGTLNESHDIMPENS